MSRELVIDDNCIRWIPALKSVREGKKPQCPICNSYDTNVEQNYEKGIGFVLITCEKCGKSGYFSRVMKI